MITQGRTSIVGHLLVVPLLVVLQACSGSTPVMVAQPVGARAAAVALEQLGVPYRYGGDTPRGFDCSGLVHYAYAAAGRAVPRTTHALWLAAEPVTDRDLQHGDLLFFRFDGKMSHVGMYVGSGRFVHAPSRGRFVVVEDLRAEYYRDAYIRAGRLRWQGVTPTRR